MSDRNRKPPFSNLENCRCGWELDKLLSKIWNCGGFCGFCLSAWQVCGEKHSIFPKNNGKCHLSN